MVLKLNWLKINYNFPKILSTLDFSSHSNLPPMKVVPNLWKKIPISIIRHQDLWNSVILVILYLFQLIIFYITTNLYKSILNKLNELSHSFPPNFFRRIRYHLPAHISFPSNINNSSLRFTKQRYFSHIISISAHNHLYNYLFIIGIIKV